MKTLKLHPENEKRANWARNAAQVFAKETFGRSLVKAIEEEGGETVIGDLIGDLGHLCRRYGIDYEAALTSAASHFAYENDLNYDGD